MDRSRFGKALVVGIVLAFTPLLAPIHELGHYIFGTDVTITGWRMSLHGTATYVGIIGGSLFELIFYTVLSWFGHLIYDRTGKFFASNMSIVAWGYINGLILVTLVNDDINKVLPSIGVPARDGMLTWLIISLPVLAAGWAIWRNILRNS